MAHTARNIPNFWGGFNTAQGPASSYSQDIVGGLTPASEFCKGEGMLHHLGAAGAEAEKIAAFQVSAVLVWIGRPLKKGSRGHLQLAFPRPVAVEGLL